MSKAKQPIALFGHPTKNAIPIAIPKNIPTAIRRLFILKRKNSQIKSNCISTIAYFVLEIVHIKLFDPIRSNYFS